MRFLSVCSGIEAATVACKDMGWEPVAFSEIDPFPNAVLEHHYPEVPNLGDICKIKGGKYRGKVELIVGGTPCQDFSVSGTRKGLDGERSGLAREYIRLLREVRPKWFVWENVPGTLSTNKGKDFGALLSEMGKLGYGVSWRILDAQFFGVPQRRRRIFVVGYLGDWRPPFAVLIEQERVRGNIEKGQGPERTSPGGVGKSSFAGGEGVVYDINHDGRPRVYEGVAPTLLTRMGTGGNQIPLTVQTFAMKSFAQWSSDTTGSTLRATGGNYGGGSENLVADKTVVRKLTPVECERLQGFPDDYTKVPYRGKPADMCPLSPRYKALGNSIAVPVLAWIFRRIECVDGIKNSIDNG